MVGFKSIWVLSMLLFFAACVPQTKQTDCKSNEAFSAALRTCVPVVGEEDSFINIQSFIPTTPLSKYKNDTDVVPFTVQIANPYAKNYTVQWLRTYNGLPIPITPDTPTSYSFAPNILSTQIGTHIISVSVFAGGRIVDSHNFEIKINDNPEPKIVSGTITPPRPFGTLGQIYSPYTSPQTFKFDVSNNGASMTSTSHKTNWFLYRGGVLIHQATNNFPTVAPLGSLSANGFNYPTYSFNPAVRGLGNYMLLSQVTTDAGDVVDDERWNITVQHPAFDQVTARPIYSGGAGGIGYTATTIAYNGIPYYQSPANNFVPTGGATPGDYCVEVASGEGRYAGNTHYVRVDYFLDASTLIYSAIASPGDTEVCLSDASPAVRNGIVFHNASPTSTQNHTIMARVYDVETATEYPGQIEDTSGLGYPFVWNFQVRPPNVAPVLSFPADSFLNNIACGFASGSVRPCTVTQGSTFTLGIRATDEYDTSSTSDLIQNHFSYSMTLFRGTTPISTCVKAFSDATDGNLPNSDYVGPEYLCNFTIPTFDATGSIDPEADNWSVSISFADNGSDVIGSSPASSPVHAYALTVKEYSDPAGPTITPQVPVSIANTHLTVDTIGLNTSATTTADPLQPSGFVTEGDRLHFRVGVSDPEMDDYKVSVFYCADGSNLCTAPLPIVNVTTIYKTDNAPVKLSDHFYDIPENLLPVNTALGTSVPSFFKIVVTDFPDYVAGVTVSSTVEVGIRNKNPPPVVAKALEVPASATIYNVAVGYPFTIDPGTIDDDSLVAEEDDLDVQWYVSQNNIAFTPIAGAKTRVLTWTPSLAYGATAYLRMCVTDSTPIYPLSGDFAGVCTGSRRSNSYRVNIINTMASANTVGTAGSTNPSTGAIWNDTSAGNNNVSYLASVEFSGGDYYINVAKMVRLASGAWDNTFQNVRFKALKASIAALPTSLSITGNANSLYVAYKCAPASAPTASKACVRRIEKGYTPVTDEKTNLTHKGKFGFNYLGMTAISNDADIDAPTPAIGSPFVITFDATTATTATLTINGVIFTADANANGVVDAGEFCGSSVAGCTTATAASRLQELINQSVDPRLQGLSATSAGNVVTITGMQADDLYESNITVLGMGNISIGGGAWHVPVINSSRAIPDVNKISVISRAVDVHLDATSPFYVVTDLNTDPASVISTAVDSSNRLVMAIVSSNPSFAGMGRLYSAPLLGSAYSSTPTALLSPLFAGESLATIRVSAAKGSNVFNYVVGYTNISNKWKIGRHDAVSLALNNTLQNLEDMAPNIGSGTYNVVNPANVKDIQVMTDPDINGEARLAVTNYVSPTSYGFYLLRLTGTNILKCPSDAIVGACNPFGILANDIASRVYLSDSRTTLTLGDIGKTANENISTVVNALIFPANTAGANFARPRIQTLNIVPESIKGNDTSAAAGTSGWQMPYVN